MPWFNVDDGFANSKPVLRIPRRYRCQAIGLWTLAGSWSAKELTDGFIPDHALEEFASTVAMAGMLVKAGLWREAAGGWQFEGWSKWQKTKEQVLTFRAAEAERKRKARSDRKTAGSSSASGVDAARTESGVPLGHHPESGQPLPTPKPSPDPLSLVTSGGGVTSVGPAVCPRHPNGNPRDEDCRGCGEVRKSAKAFAAAADELATQRRNRAAAERQAAINACDLCDEHGQIDYGNSIDTCDHGLEADHA